MTYAPAFWDSLDIMIVLSRHPETRDGSKARIALEQITWVHI